MVQTPGHASRYFPEFFCSLFLFFDGLSGGIKFVVFILVLLYIIHCKVVSAVRNHFTQQKKCQDGAFCDTGLENIMDF